VEVDHTKVATVEDLKKNVEQKKGKGAPMLLLVNRDGQSLYLAVVV